MSIANVVTRGFGPDASIAAIVMAGFEPAAASAPVFTGTIANQSDTQNDVISVDISGQWSNSPTSYAVTSGSLPTGVTVSNAGLISGTASTVQALTGIVITATNDEGSAVSNTFTWDITVAALAYVAQPTAIVGSTTVKASFTASGTDPVDYGVVVVTDGAGVPTAADVLAGTVAGAIASLSGVTATSFAIELSNALTGLSVSTAYDMYVSIDDSATLPILSNKVDFTTTALSAGGTNQLTIGIRIGI